MELDNKYIIVIIVVFGCFDRVTLIEIISVLDGYLVTQKSVIDLHVLTNSRKKRIHQVINNNQ